MKELSIRPVKRTFRCLFCNKGFEALTVLTEQKTHDEKWKTCYSAKCPRCGREARKQEW